jgi:hypothetical protein
MRGMKSIQKAFGRSAEIGCIDAQALMSPFIDSMAAPEEVARLELHLSTCDPCQRQLQSFISVKNFLLTADEPVVPVDLALQTRVRLSHVRNSNRLALMEMRLSNFVAPIALPAVPDVPVSLYKRLRTSEPTMRSFAGDRSYLMETLTVETHVGDDGRVLDYVILSGPDDPEVEQWLRVQLHFARFEDHPLFRLRDELTTS